MSDNIDKLAAQQKSDQAWEHVKTHFDDIDRIADGNFNDSEEDKFLVQKLAQLVRGEIGLRILDVEED
jgi:hypothetical protein